MRKTAKKPSRRKSPATSRTGSLTSSVPKRFVQRYFIDKFQRNGDTEWEIFTIEVRGSRGKPLKTKKQLIAKVRELVR
jgi:hypothetical protein